MSRNHDKTIAHDAILSALRVEMQNRATNIDGWADAEHAAVLGAANRYAFAVGYPQLSSADVLLAEQGALGHVDYATKFCLYVAEMIVGYRERASS